MNDVKITDKDYIQQISFKKNEDDTELLKWLLSEIQKSGNNKSAYVKAALREKKERQEARVIKKVRKVKVK